MLTPKQIEDARKKLGIDSSNPQRSTGNNLLQRLESPEEPTFLGKVARETLRPFAKAGTSLINTAQIATGQEETQPFSGEYLGEVERIGKGFDVTKGFDEENVKALKDAAKTGVDIGLLISGGGGTTGALKTGVKEGILKGAKELGKTGAIIGGASGASTGLEEGATLGSTLKNTVVGAGVGLATGSVLGVVPGGIRAGTQVVKKVGTGVRKVGQDIIPSSERLVNSQVSKALDLTQGDIKNIASSTGNEVGEFLAKHNLIGGNKDETVKLLNDFYSKNYNKVRDEISKVKKTYTNTDIPRFKQSLLEIKKQVSDVSGLEDVSKEVDTLLKKKSISLNDIQRTKELLDEHFSLYKMTGDVKEGATKSGLSNIRKELKEFIEKEVKDVSGNDIGALNNSVSTSRSTLDAIETRSTRGLTRSNIKIGDLGIFGVGAAIGSPILGLGAVVAKKIIESPSIRLKIAKFLDKLNDASRKKIQDQLLKGVMPVEIEKIVSQSSFTPKAQTKKIITQKTSISPNSTTKSLKGKGVIPKHLEPLAQEARKYKSAEDFVKAQTKSNSWSEAQKTNPDLWNKGILRRSISPVGAEGVIPKDVHTIQAKWQNYGQNSEIPADVVYKRIDSGSFKGEYEDAFGNAVRDKNGNILQDVYDEATGEWIKPEISSQQLKDALLKQFETPEGKKYLNEVINALPKNPDGTVTAYRIGSMGEGAQSYTLSEGMAKTFSNQGTDIPLAGTPGLPRGGYKDFGALPTNMVKVDPKGIKAWSPYDAEILVEPKFVKTKSQLTDIWKKANKK